MRFFSLFETQFGPARAVVNSLGELMEFSFTAEPPKDAVEDASKCARVRLQVEEFFRRERTAFDLPLARQGTEFQQRVWQMLMDIPYGETTTYGALARKLGLPDAARAVGRANATNPLALIVPCHRVIGSSGKLTGYAGGLDLKSRLLEFEQAANLFS